MVLKGRDDLVGLMINGGMSLGKKGRVDIENFGEEKLWCEC